MIKNIIANTYNNQNNYFSQPKDTNKIKLNQMQMFDKLQLSFTGRRKSMRNMPEELTQLCNHLANSKTGSDIYNTLENAEKTVPDFQKMDPVTYKFRNYKIQTALSVYADRQVDNLKLVNSFGLSSAPQLSRYIKTGEDRQEAIIITHLPDSQNPQVVSLSDAKQGLNKDAFNTFFKDMQILTSKGYIYDVKKPDTGLLVNLEDGKILINDWRPLRKATKQESITFINSVRNFVETSQSNYKK